MIAVAEIVASIFGLIAIGFLAVRVGLLSNDVGDALVEFVFKVAIPVLLFRTLATASFSDISPWPLWFAFFSGIIVVWVIAHIMIRRAFGRDARAGVVAGMSAGYANTVLVGIPTVTTVYGDEGMVWLLIIMSIHLPVLMASSLILNEWAVRADGVKSGAINALAMATRFARDLITNPIIIGIMAGALWRLVGLELGGVPSILIDRLSGVAGPMALFAAGMSLAKFGLKGNIRPAFLVALLKLIVMPAVIWGLATLVGLPPVAVATATLTAACPTGVNAFLMASRFGTGEALASNATTLSTAMAVITMSGWLWVASMIAVSVP